VKVAFAAEVLADRSVFQHLDAILYIIEDDLHEWHIDDPELIESSPWLQGGRSSHRTLFEKASTRPLARKSTNRIHSRLLLVGKHNPPDSLDPAKAAKFLGTPLRILMENRNTDGAFLDAILSVLADPEVVRLKRTQALVYDSGGGGGELKKLVEEVHAQAADGGFPLRAVVFTDSDSRWPGDIGPLATAIRETCERLDIPHVILGKRAIENYVPDEAIAEWLDESGYTTKQASIAALLRLTPEQRDHFPFKKGLSFLKSTPNQDHPLEQHRLYGTVPEVDRDLLERGFKKLDSGRDFIQILFACDAADVAAGAAEVGSVRPSLTADALRRRDDRGDLDVLVALIEEGL
jgi:hypothetical protein